MTTRERYAARRSVIGFLAPRLFRVLNRWYVDQAGAGEIADEEGMSPEDVRRLVEAAPLSIDHFIALTTRRA